MEAGIQTITAEIVNCSNSKREIQAEVYCYTDASGGVHWRARTDERVVAVFPTGDKKHSAFPSIEFRGGRWVVCNRVVIYNRAARVIGWESERFVPDSKWTGDAK